MSAASLTYDNLPPGSTLLREYPDDGGIIITAPASTLPDRARGRLRRRAAISAVWITSIVLVLCLAIFGAEAYAHRNFLPWWTASIAAIFCIALFAFVWHSRYSILADAAGRALQQITILAIRNARIIVESSGPLGVQSLALAGSDIRQIKVLRGVIKLPDGKLLDLETIQLQLHDGPNAYLFSGLDLSDLRFIERAIRQFLA